MFGLIQARKTTRKIGRIEDLEDRDILSASELHEVTKLVEKFRFPGLVLLLQAIILF